MEIKLKNGNPKRTEIIEEFWYEFLIHAKTMNTIAQIENEKYFKEHPDEADLAPPYQTTWIQEQNFWQWYLDNKMPKVVVKQGKKSASK